MSRGTIYMLGENPDFRVLVDGIWARNDVSVSTLIIPFKIEFSGAIGRHHQALSKAEVLFFKGELRTKETSLFCGENIVFMNNSLSAHEKSFSSQFNFSFPKETISKIEQVRKNDLQMHISVASQIAEYSEIVFTNQKSQSIVTGFEKGSGHVDFQIPQSQWVNLLPQLGYQPLRLIELPGTNDVIPAEYAKSLRELDEAKKYFLNGDYDKAVGHCRSALDPFKPKKDEIRKYVSSKSEFAWASDIMDATDEWLNKIVRSTSHFTSKAHHVPSTGHFGRADAEIIMMVTTAIIAFIGNVRG